MTLMKKQLAHIKEELVKAKAEMQKQPQHMKEERAEMIDEKKSIKSSIHKRGPADTCHLETITVISGRGRAASEESSL